MAKPNFARGLLNHSCLGFVDDPDNDTYLRWTNKSTLEAKSMRESSGRSDICITKSCGVKWSTSVGYGEAKPSAREQDNCLIQVVPS